MSREVASREEAGGAGEVMIGAGAGGVEEEEEEEGEAREDL